jgi:hypothetical protein
MELQRNFNQVPAASCALPLSVPSVCNKAVRELVRLKTRHCGGREVAINVLMGPNGAGKINFVSFFRFLRELIDQRLQIALATTEGGADACLYLGPRVTKGFGAKLLFGNNGYEFTLVPTLNNQPAGVAPDGASRITCTTRFPAGSSTISMTRASRQVSVDKEPSTITKCSVLTPKTLPPSCIGYAKPTRKNTSKSAMLSVSRRLSSMTSNSVPSRPIPR